MNTRRALKMIGVVTAVALSAAALGVVALLRLSLPKLEGEVVATALSAPVAVARDARGTPTIRARNRDDLAFALGYLHAQERFFHMDLQRRFAAGELADLFGSKAIERDRAVRMHRFRHRASAVLAAAQAAERRTLDAYVAGVNQGLRDLAAPSFEYLLLDKKPEPWSAEDSILVVYAMYLNLQESDGSSERRRADAIAALGAELTDFLLPNGTSLDAALDGSRLETPKIPTKGLKRAGLLVPTGDMAEEAPVAGSNNFAVAGALSARGAAIVENDMHLGLRAPNIWYRARLKEADGSLDITGVTLPGAPNIVTGSNGHIAWGFTNSQIDTSDVVILEPADGDPNKYQTPEGPKELVRIEERLCATCPRPEKLIVEESVWGPVIGLDPHGRKLANRWIAHDLAAVGLAASLELERAGGALQALEIAHRLGIPHQNIVVGDAEGNIGWTVTSAIPRRFGHDGRTPTSWAKGDSGWNGYLTPQETPTIFNPADGRIWTANARVVGGPALEKLGFGGYAHGARAGQIRDALFAKSQFEEADLLAIALDDRGRILDRWQDLLLGALRSRAAEPRFAALIPEVENWGGRATLTSIGYRLVRSFRLEAIRSIYEPYLADMPVRSSPLAPPFPRRLPTNQADEPAWRLLSERPPRLVPPGFASWDAVVDAALDKLLAAIETEAHGELAAYTWGDANRAGVKHPLVLALPALAPLLDPPDDPQPGDLNQPRVASPGFGASERFVVAPGHESTGIFHMPTGQSGHPLSPYYNLGHEDWAKASPAPFLPGKTEWLLTLRP